MLTRFRTCALAIILLSYSTFLTTCGSEQIAAPTMAWTPLPTVRPQSIHPTVMPTRGEIRQQVGDCIDDARFIEDLTIQDGTIVIPGKRLDKRWSVQNSGTCDWGPGYALVRLGEDPFVGAEEIALYPARAGSSAIWQLVLEAPEEPGDYLSHWQAQNPQGYLFGDSVFLLVVVEEPTPVPSATPLIVEATDSE
jgi:hypothetical protein